PATAQDLQELAAGLGLAADDGRDLVVSDVDEPAENRGGEHLLKEADKRAQRHLDVDGVAVDRKQRFGNDDRQRHAGPNAAERTKPPQFAIVGLDAAEEIIDEHDIAARLLRDGEAVLDGMSFREHAADVIEELDPEIGEHALRANDLFRL